MKCRVFLQVFQKVHLISVGDKKSWLNNLDTIMPFYAVAKGRSTGIFMTWAECEAQVKGFSGAKYKKFDSEVAAQDFVGSGTDSSSSHASNTKQGHKNNPYASNSKLKRSYSTASANYQKGGKSSNNKSRSKYGDDFNTSQSDEELETILSKQLDDIEKRVNIFGKGVDKILKNCKPVRSTILIDPPQAKRSRTNNNEFEVDDEGYVQVYTDGACSANGRSGAKAGIGVYWGEGHPLNVSEPVSGRATNNCGEIQAATRAIQQAIRSGNKKLTINTDSQFLINAVTKWMPGWKRKGWKLASGEPVKNEKDFKELDSVQHMLEVKWNYVEAHRGIHGNERADQLAKAGAAMYNK